MRATFLISAILVTALTVTGCGRIGFGNRNTAGTDLTPTDGSSASGGVPRDDAAPSENIFSLFNPPKTENTVQVNKYLWSASLEVLGFLPIQSVDPFTGVIATGFGTPPGGGRSYRATVLIDDPALDARSLKVSLQTRGGAANPSTVRAVEDAILTRARQLRAADSRI